MSASTATVADLSEVELVARIQSYLPAPPDWLVVGIDDDAAVVEPERNRLEVLTVDAIVEGVHFDRRFTPPPAIGHRALAVNLSDLAAMGAAPRLALLSLALPASLPCADFDGMLTGLAALAARHRLHVVGGNLTRTPGPLVVDVTVAGTVKRRQALTRGGAQPGDEVYVTGTLAAAMAGLEILRGAADGVGSVRSGRLPTWPALEQRYLYPEPRVRTGLLLSRNRAATSCIDLSDGLADGVRRIARASGVGIAVDAAALPIDPDAQRWFEGTDRDPVMAALEGGDDYELAFTVRPRQRRRLAAVRRCDVPMTRIGICTAEPSLVLRRRVKGGVVDEPVPRGFTHFH